MAGSVRSRWLLSNLNIACFALDSNPTTICIHDKDPKVDYDSASVVVIITAKDTDTSCFAIADIPCYYYHGCYNVHYCSFFRLSSSYPVVCIINHSEALKQPTNLI